MYMSDTGPKLAESDLDIMERAEPTPADQQDQHANTPDETIQQQQATSPQRPPRRLSVRTARNYCEEEVYHVRYGTNYHMVNGKE